MQADSLATYQQALDYLYSFIDFEKRPPPTAQAAKHNLGRTRALLAAVGSPHEKLSSVVVAGTKGKGSTCAILESIVRAAGYRTGLWTSPHLNSYRERIQVNRQLIDQQAIVDAVRRLRPVVESFDTASYGPPTTFELGFALALRFFVEQGVQLAILEIGMGGRYDCANTVEPLLSLVSSISYDHTRHLGETLPQIASAKAGIFKPHIPAITVSQAAEAMAVLQQTAHEVGTPLWTAQPHGIHPPDPQPRQQPTPDLPPPIPYPVPPVPALRGAFQQENARLAVCAAWRLGSRGFTITDETMRQGLAAVQWPGRLEVAAEAPLIVLDGAHNGDSAQKLAASLQSEFRFARLLLILGMSHDKQLDAILAALVPHANELILTRSRHPRAYTDLDKLAAAAQPYLAGGTPAPTPDIPEALDLARSMAHPDDLICVTGSLFVVGAARQALGLATVCD
jgi:dihydrofolate synthase/folylpolyglutamate synthase